MKKVDLSLVLACFNEGPTLVRSLEKIVEVLDSTKYKWEIIAIDDCSKDNTLSILKKFAGKKKNVSVFANQKNIGRGGTVTQGLKKAKGKIAGFIDVDLEVSPIFIPEFARAIEKGADLAIATRIYKESFSSVNRWILSKGYTLITRMFLSLDIKDTEAGYKFFNLKKILPILKKTHDKKWFFDTEIVLISARNKLKIAEIPVLFLRRIEKKSTVRIIPDTLAYLKAIYLFKRRK